MDAWFAHDAGSCVHPLQASPLYAYKFMHDSTFTFPGVAACDGLACHTAELVRPPWRFPGSVRVWLDESYRASTFSGGCGWGVS